MGKRRGELLDSAQASHLVRFQEIVLSWDYWSLRGGAKGRPLRRVPQRFESYKARAPIWSHAECAPHSCLNQEYLDIFEPLILEECRAQVLRGEACAAWRRPLPSLTALASPGGERDRRRRRPDDRAPLAHSCQPSLSQRPSAVVLHRGDARVPLPLRARRRRRAREDVQGQRPAAALAAAPLAQAAGGRGGCRRRRRGCHLRARAGRRARRQRQPVRRQRGGG